MKELDYTGSFKRDLKRITKRGYDLTRLSSITLQLQNSTTLAAAHRPHALKGQWKGYLECHVAPDWLLIYKSNADSILLVRTGTHADIFDE